MRTLGINFKHHYKTQMLLETDTLRFESLKITHELCFTSIQLQIRSRRHMLGQQKAHI